MSSENRERQNRAIKSAMSDGSDEISNDISNDGPSDERPGRHRRGNSRRRGRNRRSGQRSVQSDQHGPSERLRRLTHTAGRCLVLIMVLIAPWWIASVSTLAQLTLVSLAVLALAFWWIEMALTRQRKHPFPFLLIPLALGVLLAVVQLVPLPAGAAQWIAPRQAELYRDLGSPIAGEAPPQVSERLQSQPPVRISMHPEGTRHFRNLLVLGLIAVLLGSHYFSSRQSVSWLASALTLQGVAIASYGIYSRLNPTGKIFGFVELTYGGVPFGPFVNRNNAAGYLLICLAGAIGFAYLAFTKYQEHSRPRPIIGSDYTLFKRLQLKLLLFIAELTPQKIFSLLAVVTITSGILVSLSRGGITALLIGSLVTIWGVGLAKFSKGTVLFFSSTVVLTLALIGWLGFSQTIADRFDSFSDREALFSESRITIWTNSLSLFNDFQGMGCGLDSFRHVYRGYRSEREGTLNEFAENVYVQTLVESGWVGAALLLATLLLMVVSLRFLLDYSNSPRTVAAATIGVFAVSSQFVAAMFDFGTYIPANLVLLAVVSGFVAGQTHALADRLKKRQIFAVAVPTWCVLSTILVVFVAGVFVVEQFYRQAQLDRALNAIPKEMHFSTLDRNKSQQLIDRLEQHLRQTPHSLGYKRVAELYLHRLRLDLMDPFATQPFLQQVSQEIRKSELERVWTQTSLIALHGMVTRARLEGNRVQVERYLNDPAIVDNLPQVRQYLLASRYLSVMEPGVHLMLAQCQAFAQRPEAAPLHADRARKITPLNDAVEFTVGVLNIQIGQYERGKRALRTALELNPGYRNRVVPFLLDSGITKQEILDDVLPQMESLTTAQIWFDFARLQLQDESEQPMKLELLESVDRMLSRLNLQSGDAFRLQAAVKNQLLASRPAAERRELLQEIVEVQLRRLQLDPGNHRIQRALYDLYMELGEYEAALDRARWLRRNSENGEFYDTLIKKAVESQMNSLNN